MSIQKKYLAPFYEGGIYHIYNRTNNKELLFRQQDNHRFFLQKAQQYLLPFLDIYCWCLLPNNFHWLVKIKTENEIKAWLQSLPATNLIEIEKKYLTENTGIDKLIQSQWHRFFTSYSMAFNKMYDRTGNLFHRPFKRVSVNKESQFTQAIIYIHANPVKHGLQKDFTKYYWSSWQTVLSTAPTRLLREELINWFGNKEQFIKAHIELSQYYYNAEIAIDDD